MLYLVRHAKAGSRSRWDGDDRDRPLSTAGRLQADALAARLLEHLDGVDLPTLLSSPFVRCRETLEPLAAKLGIAVIDEVRLGEGAHFEDTIALLQETPDGSVLCSHGDVIPETIAALERRGCEMRGQPDWRKATVWLIERRGKGSDATFADAQVWPPPAV